MTAYEEPSIVDLDELLDEGGIDGPIRTRAHWVVLAVMSALAVLGIAFVLLFVVPRVAGFLADVFGFVAEFATGVR